MRVIARIIVVVVLSLGSYLFWSWRFGGRLEQSATSQNGSIVAEVRLDKLIATTDPYVLVKLRTGFLSPGDVVFYAATYGGDVRLKWLDESHLIVYLQRPAQLKIHQQEGRWEGVTILYQDE